MRRKPVGRPGKKFARTAKPHSMNRARPSRGGIRL